MAPIEMPTTSSSGNTSAADSRSVLTNTGEYSLLKILELGTSCEVRALPERSEGKVVEVASVLEPKGHLRLSTSFGSNNCPSGS